MIDIARPGGGWYGGQPLPAGPAYTDVPEPSTVNKTIASVSNLFFIS